MNSRFDRRVVPESVLNFVREAQRRVPCNLGGGAALSGANLSHRLTGDIDLFVHGERERHRELVQLLAEVAASSGCSSISSSRKFGTADDLEDAFKKDVDVDLGSLAWLSLAPDSEEAAINSLLEMPPKLWSAIYSKVSIWERRAQDCCGLNLVICMQFAAE